MKSRIMIDAGFYVGHALDYYAPFIDDTWKVYAFEPNTALDVERSLKRFPFEVEWVKKAIWVEDGELDFVIGGRDDASYIAELHEGIPEIAQKVPCIDFSKFVSQLPEGATIACSFDAEGAEFPILEKMLSEGTAKKLTLLDIEFHHRVLLNRTAEDASRLRIALESEGVLVKTKVDI